MLRKRQLTINIFAAGAQAIITGLSFFFLYRFVRETVGIERFGVWSLVLVSVTISNLANLGLGSSMVKFVSKYLALNDKDRASLIIQTALLTIGTVLLVAIIAAYPLIKWALSIHGDLSSSPELLAEALVILPFAIGSFWGLSLASVPLAAIDGHQRIDLRCGIQVFGMLGYLVAAFTLVSNHGLLGLAWAHLLQSALLFAASWFVTLRLLPELPFLPWRWNWGALREILGYSLKFQVMAIFWLLLTPLTYWLVSIFGGLASVGWLEYANRMAFQFRAVVVTAHQSIVPTIASLVEQQASILKDIYRSSFKIILFLVLLLLPLLIAATPLISILWHDYPEPAFITFSVLLFAGWFLNLLSNPAYFAYMGIGTLRWNVVGRISMGGLNFVLGGALGLLAGGVGSVVGFVLSLIAGSLITVIAYHQEYNIRLSSLIERDSLMLGGVGLISIALFLVLVQATDFDLLTAIAAPILVGLTLVVPSWRHSSRREIHQWLRRVGQSR